MNSQDAPPQQVRTLPGAIALSAFRIEKLLAGLPRPLAEAITIDTRFVHFAAIGAPLDARETQVLEKLLTYGTPAHGEPNGALLLVLPRFGTVSPWSSKATDIARNCGLDKVIRIERGVAYYILARDPGPLSQRSYRALDRALRDRMTEVMVTQLEAAAKLFEHYSPQPLAYIDVLGFGRHALQEANDAMEIAPHPGAGTGAGGEIGDEGATGTGGKPKAGLTGFSVSNLNLPNARRAWEGDYGRPSRIASALQIMMEGPIGGAAYNNEFGRPNLCGHFRNFELAVGGEVRGYHKPIMLAGGYGNISAKHTHKKPLGKSTLFIQLGGPGFLIGMGGGAASSMASGQNVESLDFDSVQRANAELERRCQEVIDACWAMGDDNPILSIHDVGAGGLSNALPEMAHAGGVGAQFILRAIPIEEPGMSPMQVWSNESQERYVLAIDDSRVEEFKAICERERCLFAVVGRARNDHGLVVEDPLFRNRPVDMPLEAILGKPPRMHRDVARGRRQLCPLDLGTLSLKDAAYAVLRHPTVADKTFLISIGDRTVGGMSARDQMVGPWQVPVADCAVTTLAYTTNLGEAMAIRQRTPTALIDGPASGRMAVGEAITNIAAAPLADIGEGKLSANWVCATVHDGDDPSLFGTARATGIELMPALGISIPVGKDSMSMRTTWRDPKSGEDKSVTAPLSLIVSAFAPVTDARRTLTPELRTDAGATELVLVDLGRGRNRMGGSAYAQVHGELGDGPPDVDDAATLAASFTAVQGLHRDAMILAYHDRSDGGLFATLCEMAFAARVGVTVNLDNLAYDPKRLDVDGHERQSDVLAGNLDERVVDVLFNEELGAVLQVRRAERDAVMRKLRDAGLSAESHVIGHPNAEGVLRVVVNGKAVLAERRVDLHRAWSQVTHHIQRLRDNPACADQEYERILDEGDPGLNAVLTFDPAHDIAAPFVAKGARPRLAGLREQGVNGQVEMAGAFDRAGFAAVDGHMSDIIAGRASLADFKAFAACGGFSFGDVLCACEGVANAYSFNPRQPVVSGDVSSLPASLS